MVCRMGLITLQVTASQQLEICLRRELGAETVREEDGVGVKEMAKTVLNRINKYCFHGCSCFHFFFFFFLNSTILGYERDFESLVFDFEILILIQEWNENGCCSM